MKQSNTVCEMICQTVLPVPKQVTPITKGEKTNVKKLTKQSIAPSKMICKTVIKNTTNFSCRRKEDPGYKNPISIRIRSG